MMWGYCWKSALRNSHSTLRPKFGFPTEVRFPDRKSVSRTKFGFPAAVFTISISQPWSRKSWKNNGRIFQAFFLREVVYHIIVYSSVAHTTTPHTLKSYTRQRWRSVTGRGRLVCRSIHNFIISIVTSNSTWIARCVDPFSVTPA